MKVGWEIMPGLIQRGLFNEWSLERKKALVDGEHVGIIVNLTRTKDDELAEWFARIGQRYIHQEIPDGKTYDIELMNSIAGEVVNWMRNGWTAVVHCRAGRNRSGFISALVVMEMLGVSGAEAVKIVQARRPLSLYNEHFVEYLESLQPPIRGVAKPGFQEHN
jgi:protein-tyrosine phosphatase